MAVIKNKTLIQSYVMTTAKYDFSVDEKRILYRIVETFQDILEGKKLRGRIYTDLFGYTTLELPISHFIPNDSTNYERIKKAFRSLNEKKFEYEDATTWEIIRIIEKPVIKLREKVRFELNPKIIECFCNYTKGFRKYELKVAMQFKSVYSMRFYELMAGQESPLTYSIDKLRELFLVQDKYKETKDFIKRVIIPAHKELRAKSPYAFDYKLNKSGKKITSITFFPVYQPNFMDEELELAELHQYQLSTSTFISLSVTKYLKENFGFTSTEIKKNKEVLKKANEQFDLMGFISLMKGKIRGKEITNPKGYLINAIKTELEQRIDYKTPAELNRPLAVKEVPIIRQPQQEIKTGQPTSIGDLLKGFKH